jgi:hypothetical protein
MQLASDSCPLLGAHDEALLHTPAKPSASKREPKTTKEELSHEQRYDDRNDLAGVTIYDRRSIRPYLKLGFG